MAQRLLLDIGPTAGSHGARGIGSYVRGLTEAIGEWPAERRQMVWALAYLELFRLRGVLRKVSPSEL